MKKLTSSDERDRDRGSINNWGIETRETWFLKETQNNLPEAGKEESYRTLLRNSLPFLLNHKDCHQTGQWITEFP